MYNAKIYSRVSMSVDAEVLLPIMGELLKARSHVIKPKSAIFISHSKRDLKSLVNPAAEHVRSAGLEAYIASLRAEAKNPAEKIVDAITACKAVFAIITRNVSDYRDTRDWVLFEIGAAKVLRKPVFGWKTVAATVPEPIKQVTDYITFDPEISSDVKEMLQLMRNIARGFL
jgi:hypothetical protein